MILSICRARFCALIILPVLLIGVALALSSAPSQAQTKFPDKPVRLILPYGPGGIADVTTRVVAQKLSQRMGQNFFIDNRPGAAGILSARAALGFPADGYTYLETGNAAAIGQSLFKSLPYDVNKDFTSVAMLAQFEVLLATKTNSKFGTIAQIVTFAKKNPGKLNFGTVAVGSTQNLAAQLFRMTTGINAQIVTYRTTPELVTAIIRGDVDVGFDYYAAFRPMIVSKKMKVIAISADHPNKQLPGVPTVKDSGYPGYVVTSWNGLSAVVGTPKAIITKMNHEVEAVLKQPDVEARMSELGMEPLLGTPEQMTERLKSDAAKWRDVIEKAGIPKQ